MRERPVVLLHGLARTRWSVEGMRRFLEAAGLRTWSRSYPSRRLPLPELADWVAERIEAELGQQEVMAVTHSLGGIVLRHLAGRVRVGRAVLIAPPNQGSRVAHALHRWSAFRAFYGPAGQAVARPENWPDPPEPFAVIAGTRQTSPGAPLGLYTRLTGLLPPALPSDGVVAVEETRHPRMAAHALVDATHTWILDHPETRALTLRFLREGHLQPLG